MGLRQEGNSHLANYDKEMWEAVQLEMERRRNFALEYGILKLEYATEDNPFAGRVICGLCGRVFGRRVWNPTDDRPCRVVWQCSAKYEVKGMKGCNNNHIDEDEAMRIRDSQPNFFPGRAKGRMGHDGLDGDADYTSWSAYWFSGGLAWWKIFAFGS